MRGRSVRRLRWYKSIYEELFLDVTRVCRLGAGISVRACRDLAVALTWLFLKLAMELVSASEASGHFQGQEWFSHPQFVICMFSKALYIYHIASSVNDSKQAVDSMTLDNFEEASKDSFLFATLPGGTINMQSNQRGYFRFVSHVLPNATACSCLMPPSQCIIICS